MRARGLTREQVMNDVLLAAQPTKKFVTVDQVAALALFLCRDEAGAITGANLSMDGGWTAPMKPRLEAAPIAAGERQARRPGRPGRARRGRRAGRATRVSRS